jgi:predicted RNA binding protein YcfA (HicA-like mRNA interferase family)
LPIGWTLKKQVGSHRKLQRSGWPNFTFFFQDGEEVGPAAPAKIGKETGLQPEDLSMEKLAHRSHDLFNAAPVECFGVKDRFDDERQSPLEDSI